MPVWGLVLAFFSASVWALSPIFVKESLDAGSSPAEVNPVRSIGYLATVAIAMLLFQPGKWPDLSLLLMAGLFINVCTSSVIGDQMYTYSIDKIGPSLAVSVSCIYPLVTTAFSIIILGEKIGMLVWVGTISIVCGILIIKYDATRNSRDESAEFDVNFKQTRAEKLKGIFLALGAAVLWGINLPFLKKMMVIGNWNGIESHFLRSLMFVVAVWALRLFQARKFPNSIRPLGRLPLKAWVMLLCNGSIGIALGGIAFAVCIQTLPVSVVTPVTASSPFITVLICRVFLKEKLSGLQRAGIFFVIAGSIGVSI